MNRRTINHRMHLASRIGNGLCLVLIAAISLLALASCNQDQDATTGSLHLILGCADRYASRNIGPGGTAPLEIATYKISGIGPNGKTLAEITTNHDDLTINGLATGTWTLQAKAYNANGKALVAGTVTLYIAPSSNSVELEMDTPQGSGTLQVSYSWNAQQSTANSILSMVLVDSDNQETPLTPTTINKSAGSATLVVNSLAAGFYTLRTTLMNGSDRLAGDIQSVRIIEGTVSTGTITLTIGGIVDEFSLVIVDNTMNPIQGSIACSPTVPVKGQSATLTYTPVLPAGVTAAELSKQWYVDGQVVSGQTSLALTVNPVLAGSHRYDLVLGHPSQGSIGSAGLILSVPTDPVVVTPML